MMNYKTPILEPDDMPLVALESMNRTHSEELELVNRLAGLLAQGIEGASNDKALTDCLEQWMSHTRKHFESENRLMAEYGFPAYPVHSGEHDRVLELLEGLRQGWLERRDPKPLADFLFGQWPQWFDNHVNSMDAVTARFLIQHGA